MPSAKGALHTSAEQYPPSAKIMEIAVGIRHLLGTGSPGSTLFEVFSIASGRSNLALKVVNLSRALFDLVLFMLYSLVKIPDPVGLFPFNSRNICLVAVNLALYLLDFSKSFVGLP